MPSMSQPKISPSVCPLDCPDTCSLSVTVQDGKVRKVAGSQANPFTAGVICNKVARSYPDFVHGKDRLRQPMRRIGPKGQGQFRAISWSEALDLVHAGLTAAIDEYGAQSVVPFNYAGPHGELAMASMDRRFFNRLGATQLDRGAMCGAVRGLAYTSLFGAVPGMPPEQAAHSDLIVVWGNNVTVSNLHLMRVIKAARTKGARVVVIDPRRIKLAEQADLHIQLKPGTDVVLALGLAAELERRGALDMGFVAEHTLGFEPYMESARTYGVADVSQICGISEAQVVQIADWIAEAQAMACASGNGIERGRSGGSALRAAFALNALTGHHGRLGAGVIAKTGLGAPKTPARLQASHFIPEGTRTIDIADVPRRILDDNMRIPIRALVIYNHNPVATHPDQERMIEALGREDLFSVGIDVVMTDSMAFCDVILPASSHFEFDDIYGAYGQNYLQRAEAVIPPVAESLPNTEIFRRLAARFGFDEEEFQASDAELMDQAMDAAHPVFEGRAPSQLPLDRAVELTAKEHAPAILCKTVWPQTSSGKIELYSQALEDEFGFGLPRHDPVSADLPWTLITPSSDKRTNATFGNFAPSAGAEGVEMHPDDATEQGLADGDLVLLRNSQGSVAVRLVVTDRTRPGVLYCAKGAWLSSSQTGRTANVLISADLRTDIARGVCYNETFVTVEKHRLTA